MKLRSITIGGFRNLKKTTINFDGLTTLIALNSYGKSNVLRGIEFAVNFYKASPALRQKYFKLESALPLNQATCYDDFYFEMHYENTGADLEEKNVSEVIYGYTFKWYRNDETGAKITAEWLRVKPCDSQKFSQIIKREEDSYLYKSSESGRCSKKTTAADDELLIHKLAAIDNYFCVDTIKQIFQMEIYIDHHLDASREYEVHPIISTQEDVLALDSSSGIPRTFAILKEKHPDEYERLTNAFCQLFPNISQIEVKEYPINMGDIEGLPKEIPYKIAKSAFVLWVVDDTLNQPIRFEDLSDGAKRILWMLTCLVKANLNNLVLVAIEEPEDSIHPRLLQAYLNIIHQMLGNCSILMTSHSPYIVGYLRPEALMIGIPTEKGEAYFYPVNRTQVNNLIKDAKDANMTTGGYIFDLLSGSDDDTEQLAQYLDGCVIESE